MPDCDTVGHEMKEMGGRQSCVRTTHAEANAIAQAARNGASTNGATIYTTASPCYDCAKLIINAGIVCVVYGEFYASRYGASGSMTEFLRAAKLTVIEPAEVPAVEPPFVEGAP
jgi:deoxycytidylate deaminase